VLLPAPGFLLLSVSGAGSASLLARLLAPATVGAMHGAFVLLPALVAFLAISVPAAWRGAMRGRRDPMDLLRAAILTAAAVVYVSSGAAGWPALASLVAVLGVAAIPAAPLLSRAAPWLASRATILASACWLGVVWYQLDLLQGAEASYAIAPSLAVMAMALSVVALMTATARAAADPTPAWLAATILGWSAMVLALLAPRIGPLLPAAGHLEAAMGALAAVLGLGAVAIGRDRSAGSSRSAAPSHTVASSMENP
jgi:hypothetical protein